MMILGIAGGNGLAHISPADLLIEYIGYDHFQHVVRSVHPRYVSCIIQADINWKTSIIRLTARNWKAS